MCRSRRDQEAKESPRCNSSEPSGAARLFSRGRWRSPCSDCMLQYVVRGLRSGSYLRTYMQSCMLGASPQALGPLSCMCPERLSATALACSSYVVVSRKRTQVYKECALAPLCSRAGFLRSPGSLSGGANENASDLSMGCQSLREQLECEKLQKCQMAKDRSSFKPINRFVLLTQTKTKCSRIARNTMKKILDESK